MFNFEKISGCNFSGSADKSFVMESLKFATKEIDNAASLIRDIASGDSPITALGRRPAGGLLATHGPRRDGVRHRPSRSRFESRARLLRQGAAPEISRLHRPTVFRPTNDSNPNQTVAA